MIEIRLQPAGYVTRRTCFFCGSTTEKDEFVAEVYLDGQRTGQVVCPDYPSHRGCIGQPAAVLAERLREQAECYRSQADALERIAIDVPEVPTTEAWELANTVYQEADRVIACLTCGRSHSALYPCGPAQARWPSDSNPDDLPF